MLSQINNLLTASTMNTIKEHLANRAEIIVFTPTEAHAHALLAFAYTQGCQFGPDKTYAGRNRYVSHKGHTCYRLKKNKKISFSHYDNYKENTTFRELPMLELK